jgi:hypothetical protein
VTDNPGDISDQDLAAAVVALVVAGASRAPEPRPLREPLSPWVASGWVASSQHP